MTPDDEPKAKDPAATPKRSRGVPLSLVLPLVALAAIVASVTVLLVSNHSTQALPGNAQSRSVTGYDGQVLEPLKPAPSFGGLRNYLGEPVSLAAYRGKAVLVTFLYTHCPDICPLIASNLHNAYARMTPAQRAKVDIVAVSVDPRGDNAGTVGTFMRSHQLAGEGEYLIGSARQLVPVWKSWNVGSEKDVSRPDLVNHSALIYGLSASGKIYTIYPANFAPEQIIHDVAPLLSR